MELGVVVGGHGDTTMIPLTRFASYKGVPVSQMLSSDVLAKVKADTMVGGATLTGMLGTSAWYAPGAAVSVLVQSLVCDQKKMMACCVSLDGEYGQSDICIGVPVILGKSGWERIVELELNDEEYEGLMKYAYDKKTRVNIDIKAKSSYKAASMTMVKAYFGSGILALPYCFN